ncbi:MAG: hypothetical protein ABH841_00225 [Candidatus Nealsonbacteria bacterium]
MKKIIPIIIALAIVGGGGFFVGMKYEETKIPQRQQFFQGNVGGTIQRGVERGTGAGFLNGEVIDKDGQSLTLKMTDGSSKIVFFSASTAISKTAEGTINDVEIGKQIMVSGTQNSDGSYTANTIQLSPSTRLPVNK